MFPPAGRWAPWVYPKPTDAISRRPHLSATRAISRTSAPGAALPRAHLSLSNTRQRPARSYDELCGPNCGARQAILAISAPVGPRSVQEQPRRAFWVHSVLAGAGERQKCTWAAPACRQCTQKRPVIGNQCTDGVKVRARCTRIHAPAHQAPTWGPTPEGHKLTQPRLDLTRLVIPCSDRRLWPGTGPRPVRRARP